MPHNLTVYQNTWIYVNKNITPLSENHQLANRYALAKVDMEEVIDYLDSYHQINRLQNGDNNSLWAKTCRGLLSAAIVAYCRPFSNNNSTGYATAKLSAQELLSVRKHRSLHNLLIKNRNTCVAHADWKARSVEITVVGLGSLNVTFTEPNIKQGVDLNEFRELVDEVRQDCIFKVFPHARAGIEPVGNV